MKSEIKTWWLVYNSWVAAYDESPEEKAAREENERKARENNEKRFTQEEVNRMLADDKRKHQTQQQKLLSDLQKMQQEKSLSEEAKTALDERIRNLEESLMTKEELTKRREEQLKAEAEQKLNSLTQERDGWKNRFVKSTTRRALVEAAVNGGAFSPDQIVALLEPNTRLVEEVGADGKPTGEFIPEVSFETTGKDGKPVKLKLSPTETIKQMKNLTDKYGNLFKGAKKGGLGGDEAPVTGQRFVSGDQTTYSEARKARLKAEGRK